MAHDVLYKNTADEILYAVDFTDELPGDTTVSASSAVSAVDSEGSAASSVVGTVTQSGMEVRVVLQAGSDGEDYLFTITGRGTTTSRDSTKILELRVRNKLQGNL